MRRIGVLSSGGDTPGMNAAIRAVVQTGLALEMEVYGIRHGFRGLLEGDIHLLTSEEVRNINYKGGTILKTSRCKEFETEAGQKKAVEMIAAYELDGIVVIGGDGSMRGAAALCGHGVPTITLPGTIDNDLAYTDFTIGFDTAVNGVIEEIVRIRDTMVSHDRIGVVEVMGNHCGDIALYAGLAGSMDFIIGPEVGYDLGFICDRIMKNRLKGILTSMVIVAEGAAKAGELAKAIHQQLGVEVKPVVLGYTQRGGNPTAGDRVLAARLGSHAVRLLQAGKSNLAVGIRGNQIVSMDIMQAVETEKVFDEELYMLANLLSHAQ